MRDSLIVILIKTLIMAMSIVISIQFIGTPLEHLYIIVIVLTMMSILRD